MGIMSYDAEYFKRYYLQHREGRLVASKARQQANREQRIAYMRQYYKDHSEKFRRTREQQDKVNAARRQKYAADHIYRDRQKATVAKWQNLNPDKRLDQRMRRYGITGAEYARLLKQQRDRCAICENIRNGDSRVGRFHVDHCHETGTVRGLLCAACNLGLGKFQHEPARLERAILYLRGRDAVQSPEDLEEDREPSTGSPELT
jgi:hypothetical protein